MAILRKKEDKVAALFKKVNWQRFCNFIEILGPQLDSRALRFIKGYSVERAVCLYCLREINHVGMKQLGKDLSIFVDKVSVEVKFHLGSLNNKRDFKEQVGKNVKLRNSMGKNACATLPDDYADYLLLIDRNAAAIVAKRELEKVVKNNGDALVIGTAIPLQNVVKIFGPQDCGPRVRYENQRNKSELADGIFALVDKFIKGVPS